MTELTGNDIALASMQLIHALNWHKAQPKNDFTDREIEKIVALRTSLEAIADWAYPAGYEDPMDGDEILMVMSRDQFGDVDGRAETLGRPKRGDVA